MENLTSIRQQLEQPIPMSFPLGRRWYVTEVFAKCEFKAEGSLKQAGFDAYTPRSRHFRKSEFSSRRRQKIERPLFPGYCFVAFDIEREEWQGIIPLTVSTRNYLAADGVRALLSNNLIPARIQPIIVERLRRAEQAGIFDFTRPLSSFAPGDNVEIMEGPFAGLVAKIKSASIKKRVRLLIGTLMVEIEAHNLVRVA